MQVRTSGKVDIDQLKQIAGGGAGVDCSAENDCDLMFKKTPQRTDRCYVFFARDARKCIRISFTAWAGLLLEYYLSAL